MGATSFVKVTILLPSLASTALDATRKTPPTKQKTSDSRTLFTLLILAPPCISEVHQIHSTLFQPLGSISFLFCRAHGPAVHLERQTSHFTLFILDEGDLRIKQLEVEPGFRLRKGLDAGLSRCCEDQLVSRPGNFERRSRSNK